MNLYIEIENNQPINHPALEDNLIQAFGSVPLHWEPFTRVQRPIPGVYQILESEIPVYAKVDGVWTDTWNLRDMTAEERTIKQQEVQNAFNAHENAANWSTWTFDETTCTMVPPVTHPELDQTKIDARIATLWCGSDNNWKDTPVRPEGNYKFDYFSWQWVQISNDA